jgi:pyridoxamine 5'-phosphate oxidase
MMAGMADELEVAHLRREYGPEGLDASLVDPDPITQFCAWLGEAVAAGVREPNAMTLATADAEGAPSARTVLLKGIDEGGFTFYTNYGSRKARELDANPRAALVFLWHELERQVTVAGTVARVSAEESDAYFNSRPLGSRLGAWASRQSSVIPHRGVLDEARARAESMVVDGILPRPELWGGYRLTPHRVELWQGRPNRLHDRLEYHRSGPGWALERLSP